MDASAIRFENWLPQSGNSGVQWWQSPPVPRPEPGGNETRQPDVAAETDREPLPPPSPDDQAPTAACSAVSP